jgi:hypothetical protein
MWFLEDLDLFPQTGCSRFLLLERLRLDRGHRHFLFLPQNKRIALRGQAE